AGYSAALYASRAGLDTVVIERLSPGGQMALTGDIDNYPGFEEGVDGFTLGMKMQQSAERFGAKTEYAEVTEVDLSGKIKKLETTSGTFLGKTVVISSGANPRELGIAGERELVGSGVHYCAHCDGRFYKDKTVIVVGGGNTAAADALYLARLAKKVYVVHRRDTLRATKIYHEPLLNAENVEFVWNSSVTEIVAEGRVVGAKVTDVNTGQVREIACDGIFVSIGRTPATAFLGGSVQLDDAGYIVADESTRTNAEGVFAVGDVRTKVLRQVVTAVADGAVAVHYAEEYIAGLESVRGEN
ncbi:MAG: thioredoxin-disulfide reductase, partial [Oscillospiraceae bacterium]|nr:thioredoxin-disulfide reductase [Oscillospiraceae bacterium]